MWLPLQASDRMFPRSCNWWYGRCLFSEVEMVRRNGQGQEEQHKA